MERTVAGWLAELSTSFQIFPDPVEHNPGTRLRLLSPVYDKRRTSQGDQITSKGIIVNNDHRFG